MSERRTHRLGLPKTSEGAKLLEKILQSTPDLTGRSSIRHRRSREQSEGLGNDARSRRCFYIAGDFFTSVSQGAGAYLLFGVIHDWDDRRVIRILQKLPPGYGREAKSATCR